MSDPTSHTLSLPQYLVASSFPFSNLKSEVKIRKGLATKTNFLGEVVKLNDLLSLDLESVQLAPNNQFQLISASHLRIKGIVFFCCFGPERSFKNQSFIYQKVILNCIYSDTCYRPYWVEIWDVVKSCTRGVFIFSLIHLILAWSCHDCVEWCRVYGKVYIWLNFNLTTWLVWLCG